MTRNRLVDACFIALLLFIVYQAWLIFRPFFTAIFWAGLLAGVVFWALGVPFPVFFGALTFLAALLPLAGAALVFIAPVVLSLCFVLLTIYQREYLRG